MHGVVHRANPNSGAGVVFARICFLDNPLRWLAHGRQAWGSETNSSSLAEATEAGAFAFRAQLLTPRVAGPRL
jgi:hypothetical protein